MTRSRSRRKGETDSETGPRVRLDSRVPDSQSPPRVHSVDFFLTSSSLEGHSSCFSVVDDVQAKPRMFEIKVCDPYLVLGKPWALYIKHQEYIYYIYILTQCHDTLCPETLVDQTMLPLSEGGSLFSLTLKFLQKIQITSLLASFQKHAAKIDSDLTRTIRPPFFNWRIGEIVLGQAAVLSTVGVG